MGTPSAFATALGGALLGGALLAAPAWCDSVFGEPLLVRSGEAPIAFEVGHAAPCVTDFDADGVPDLLVGQFGDGKLLVFRNTGTAAAPVLGKAAEFTAGGEAGKVPSG